MGEPKEPTSRSKWAGTMPLKRPPMPTEAEVAAALVTDPKPVSAEEVAREIASVAGAPIEGCSEAFNMSLKMAIPTVARRVLPILTRLILAAKIEALDATLNQSHGSADRTREYLMDALSKLRAQAQEAK